MASPSWLDACLAVGRELDMLQRVNEQGASAPQMALSTGLVDALDDLEGQPQPLPGDQVAMLIALSVLDQFGLGDADHERGHLLLLPTRQRHGAPADQWRSC